MTQLIILDEISTLPVIPDCQPSQNVVHLLNFCPDQDIVDKLTRMITARGLKVNYISAAGKLDSIALQAGKDYSKLIAEAPLTFKKGKRNLKQVFTFDDRLSLWWLNELSGKRSDAYFTLTRICQLELIRKTAVSVGATSVDLITEDSDFWDMAATLCRQTGMQFHSRRPQSYFQSLFFYAIQFAVIVLASIKWLLRTWVQTLMAKVAVRWIIPNPKVDRGGYVFYTHYPGMWKSSGGQRDDKYARVPDIIRKTNGKSVVYACTFISDGIHQGVSIRSYLNCCRWLHSKSKDAVGLPVYLMDADVKLVDFLSIIRSTAIIWHYLRLERSHEFSKKWLMGGINIFPLIRQELRIAMKRTPRYLLHLLRVRRSLNKIRPACFVSYHFEFCYGRAMIYGAKTLPRPPVVVGVQHGPTANRKLQYYHLPGELKPQPQVPEDFIENAPLPDWIIVEGNGAKMLLTDSGYPSNRIVVGGAPRLNELLQVPIKNASEHKSNLKGKKQILVVLGGHDGDMILSACLPVMRTCKNCHFIFKIHPRSGFTAKDVETLLYNNKFQSSYKIAVGSVYKLMSSADIILTTYSSVGMEALAKNYPIICLQLPNKINLSPLLDIKTSNVVMVTNEEELQNAIAMEPFKAVSSAKQNEAVMQYFFGKFDENAETRWAKIITQIMNQRMSDMSIQPVL